MTSRIALALVIAAISTSAAAQRNSSMTDACVFEALGQLPKVEGARVTSTKPEYHHSARTPDAELEFWDIVVLIDFNGRPLQYRYFCRVKNGIAGLIKRPD